jgi:hypothetical protein
MLVAGRTDIVGSWGLRSELLGFHIMKCVSKSSGLSDKNQLAFAVCGYRPFEVHINLNHIQSRLQAVLPRLLSMWT